MDRMKRPKTHATSVTTREGNKIGVQGLSFWLGAPHSLTCFLHCLRSEFWKHGAFSDLQQFVFNKQWQTTSSPFPLSLLPLWRLLCLLSLWTSPQGSHIETDMAQSLIPNSGISFLQTSWVVTRREYPANGSPVNRVPVWKSKLCRKVFHFYVKIVPTSNHVKHVLKHSVSW